MLLRRDKIETNDVDIKIHFPDGSESSFFASNGGYELSVKCRIFQPGNIWGLCLKTGNILKIVEASEDYKELWLEYD